MTITGNASVVHGSRQQRKADQRLGITTHKRDFIILSKKEQNILHDKLLAKCHSSARLQAQGYRLTVSPPEKKPRKEKTPKEMSPEDKAPAKSSSGKKARQEKSPEAGSDQNNSSGKTASKELSKFSKVNFRETILFTHTPRPFPGQSYETRKAIALDCEMVAVTGGQDELAFLSAVDFFTGEVLIHSYVQPTKRVIQWRSSVSGISPTAMAAAIAAGQTLRGWRSAQQALWKYADADTVLIGHCLQYDLNVLRIIHPKVVDSAIVSGEAVFNKGPDAPLKRVWALKTVAKEFLNRDIQTGGRRGHDSLEDTYATRDVVIWCLRNPDQLAAWGENARAEHELKMEQLRKAYEAREQERRRKRSRRKSRWRTNGG
ncbi:ribonuclease H-like domain-containing protein [Aspergillus varians]